jgi:hypothetical protein
MDVLKIRMQTTSSGSYRSAVQHIMQASGTTTAARGSVLGFYRGLTPAIEQRIVARGPMFLVSELFTQCVEDQTPLKGTEARWAGSIASGYVVGVLAGLAEYRKKLLSQSVITGKEARWGNLVRTAFRAGEGGSLARRLHAAGACASVYDSTFFGTQDALARSQWSAPASFGAAAVCATIAAFAFDTGVARMMVVAPGEGVRGLLSVVSGIATEGNNGKWSLAGAKRLYRGLPARSVEFAISYVVTGAVSVYVVGFFNQYLEDV